MPDSYITGPGEQHRCSVHGDSRLGGTGRLADDLYLIAHDDRSGRRLIGPRPLGLGLAGGLLAELMLAGLTGLHGDGTVRISSGVPRNVISKHHLLSQIAAEPVPHPVRNWLPFLASRAAGTVAARLTSAGYLTEVPRRLPWLPARLAPADPSAAITPIGRARAAMDPRDQPSHYAGALAGLAYACGLGFRLDQYLTAGRPVADTVALLPPALRELITQTQAAVSAAVLTHRA